MERHLKNRVLPKFRGRMRQTASQAPLFSPFFSGKTEKKGPPEARQKRPRRNEPPQATSVSSVLVSSFPNRKLNLRFGFYCKSATTSQSACGCQLPCKGSLLNEVQQELEDGFGGLGAAEASRKKISVVNRFKSTFPRIPATRPVEEY